MKLVKNQGLDKYLTLVDKLHHFLISLSLDVTSKILIPFGTGKQVSVRSIE